MTKCFEVTSKRWLLTSMDGMCVYSKGVNKTFVCKDEKIFESLKIGDFFGIDQNDKIIKRISKNHHLLRELKSDTTKPATILK